MAIQKNSINKLIAEIHVSRMEDAGAAQNSVSGFLKEKLLPLIEEVANRLTLPGEVLRIDRLELDFDNFLLDADNESALLKFEKQLEEELRRLISLPVHGLPGEATGKISAQAANEELFIFLIKEGCLPWWAKTTEPIALSELAELVLQQATPTFKQELLVVLKHPSARKRMAWQLPLPLLEKLILLLAHEPAAVVQLIVKVENLAVESAHLTVAFQRLVREQAFNDLAKLPAPGLQQFISDLSRAVQKNEAALPPDVVNAIQAITLLQQAAETILPASGIKKEKHDEEEHVLRLKKNSERAHEKKTPSGNKPEPWDFEAPSTAKDEVFVKNAGLIILSPYLPSFFKKLGLVQESQFVSFTAQQRAVCLLHYLSTGNDQHFDEHALLLNKTLCGMNLLTPLALAFELTQEEREECSALLQSVVSHWTALKNTSAESMRDAFFMRDGILESHANGWNLKIERTTLDVLVDKLPWGISIVKLPWSNGLIFVNW